MNKKSQTTQQTLETNQFYTSIAPTAFDQAKPGSAPTAFDQAKPGSAPTAFDQAEPGTGPNAFDQAEPGTSPTAFEQTKSDLGPTAFEQTKSDLGPNAFDQAIIKWIAPEYIEHAKGWKWFFAAGVAVFLLIIYAAATSNWTMVIALLVLAGLYTKLYFENPKPVEIVISKAGIKAGNKTIPFQDIKAFWIIYDPPHVKTLNLKMVKSFQQDVSIQLGDQDPADLRRFLCAQIYEVEGKKESFADLLIRIFKL